MHILVLGGNSDIAYEVVKVFGKYTNASFSLASQNMASLKKKIKDLHIRYGVDANALFFDSRDTSSHRNFYNNLNPKPDGVILAFGYMGNQQLAQKEFVEASKIIEINFLGAVSILEIMVSDITKTNLRFIIGFSSVAGERGRQSNYFYGASKGAFSIYLSGLRNRFGKQKVLIMTVLAGFVHTKMTEHLPLPKILLATPEDVAKDVYEAFKKGKEIVYTKWFWRYILFVLKIIPEKIFKKLNI